MKKHDPQILKDFIPSDYSSFETYFNIWKNETKIYVDFPNKEDKNQCLNNNLKTINDELNWLEKNKDKIEELLLENGSLELAEDWASSAPLLDCSEEECYIMEDGQKVFFPISDDDFSNSLYIETISMKFDECDETPLLELILLCSPDYFAEHCLIVEIDKNKSLKFNGLNG
ncbi:MAG: DUF2262 domain-containing protein [Methanobrevibacter sp.]|nr:DUF2262 domain-containing protein [Methanobrevibacter sp.]